MHDRLECQDTTVIVGRYASGDERAFDQLYLGYRDAMVRVASQAIACRHCRDVCCDADLVVDAAFIDLRTARNRGALGKMANAGEFFDMLKFFVKREIAHERDRVQAKRRGGRKATHVPLDDAGLEVVECIVAKADQPKALLSAREEFEGLHDLLDDPVQQTILTMRYEGYTIKEICGRVNRSPRSVKRDIADIRRIYAQLQVKRR